MPEEKDIDSPLLEKKPERSGEFLFRVLKPFGCILVLVIFVLYLVFCFTYKGKPTEEKSPNSEPVATEIVQP